MAGWRFTTWLHELYSPFHGIYGRRYYSTFAPSAVDANPLAFTTTTDLPLSYASCAQFQPTELDPLGTPLPSSPPPLNHHHYNCIANKLYIHAARIVAFLSQWLRHRHRTAGACLTSAGGTTYDFPPRPPQRDISMNVASASAWTVFLHRRSFSRAFSKLENFLLNRVKRNKFVLENYRKLLYKYIIIENDRQSLFFFNNLK